MVKQSIRLVLIAGITVLIFRLLIAGQIAPTATDPVDTQFDTSHLTEMQKYVTLEAGTEPPFDNEYWDNKEPGIYVDVISGQPLFSSTDKFASGTGWPSFTKPIMPDALKKLPDHSLGMVRTEVRSSDSGAHLGHVFKDGPADRGGLRYCINSAALRFVPVAQMAEEGYGEFLPLFGRPAPEEKTDAGNVDGSLPQPDYLAVFFYAQDCGHCKELAPKIESARSQLPTEANILFITLDIGNAAARHQSMLLASQLGIGSYVKEQGSATGYLTVLDANTFEEVARFDSSTENDAFESQLNQLVRPNTAAR